MARKTEKKVTAKPKTKTEEKAKPEAEATPPPQAPIPATEPTAAARPAPAEQTSPPEAEVARPGEGVEAEKPRKPLEIQEVTAEKEKDTPTALPPELIERAKKVGFTDEQIASYTDPEALEMACNRIKPQTTPQPQKKRQIFRPFKEKPKGKPAKATCISEISARRAAHVIRAGYDQSNMEVFCRQYKPKILPESIQKVTVVRNYVPNKKDILTSKIIIQYLKEG